jgi:hypothetical protein
VIIAGTLPPANKGHEPSAIFYYPVDNEKQNWNWAGATLAQNIFKVKSQIRAFN